MWRPSDPQGNEAAKVRWDIVPYTMGRGLDIGCGKDKAFPHFIGVDNLHHQHAFGIGMSVDVVVKDCVDLSMFSNASMDFVFSSHTLEHVEDTAACLKEWWRLVKPGGHLVLYLPHKHYYPNVGDRDAVNRWLIANAEPTEPVGPAIQRLVKQREGRGIKAIGALYAGTIYANSDHKHDFLPRDITDLMMRVCPGWEQIEDESRNEGQEYSFFQVYRKRADDHCVIHNNPWKKAGSKMVCVCRFGGFGDMIQASSILPALKDEGWHVTFMTTPKGKDILEHDPHIDRWLLQDTDQVPNGALPDFWAVWRKKFDRFINLSESVEGTLLAMPGRVNHAWPDELRRKYMGLNYLEFMHEIAAVPMPARQGFYPSEEETQWAQKEIAALGGFTIMWALSGSSVHKAYPFQDYAMAMVLRAIPEARFILVGDQACTVLEKGWQEDKRVLRTSGKWSVRKTLAAAQECDMVVGPETGVLNAVGLCHNTKIVMLSHSSPENLTRDWINTDTMIPDVPCYPCHRMHVSREFCPEFLQPIEESAFAQDEQELQRMTALGFVKDGLFQTGAALCTSTIPAELIFQRIKFHYDAWRNHRVIPAAG